MFSADTTFLVVDDSAAIRAMVCAHLGKLGFSNFQEAENGQDALNLLNLLAPTPNPVQVIISDWNMPVLSGIDFLKAVRSNPSTSALPFLMVTGESDLKQVLAALTEGVSDYVVKPFTEETFYKKLTSVWNKTAGKTAGVGAVN